MDQESVNKAQWVLNHITYKEGYRLLLLKDPDGWYYQVECDRPDAMTGVPGKGRGGKGYLRDGMSLSDLVRMAFGLFRAYEEHECREFFRYVGKAVFGPHIDVHALHDVADKLE